LIFLYLIPLATTAFVVLVSLSIIGFDSITPHYNGLVLVCFVLGLSSAFAQTSPQEIFALSALYNATGGPNWRIPWTMNGDPCATNWNGLSCRNVGSNQFQIWSLVLKGNNLRGTIPSEIGLLTNVQFLYLSGNNLYGTIPSTLGNLRQLVQFGFDKNQLTGGFPEMSQLGGLQTVYLQDNLLTGPLDPFGRVPNLQYLWLDRNSLQGTLPASLGEIFSLQQIGVDYNQLTGTVPSEFGVKQNIFQAFYGQNNQFSGVFPKNLCIAAQCDLSGPANVFSCPLPNPPCCHVLTCKQ